MQLDTVTDRRLVIMGWLMRMANAMGEFEQTTHGRIGTDTLTDVCELLAKMYRKPTAYNISNFVQATEHWFKAGGKADESQEENNLPGPCLACGGSGSVHVVCGKPLEASVRLGSGRLTTEDYCKCGSGAFILGYCPKCVGANRGQKTAEQHIPQR